MNVLIEKKIRDMKGEGNRILARFDELAEKEKLDTAEEAEFKTLQARQKSIREEIQKWKETDDDNAALKEMFNIGAPAPTPFGAKQEKGLRALCTKFLAENKEYERTAKMVGEGSLIEKTLVTVASATSAGASVITDRLPGLDSAGLMRDLTLFDLIGRLPVSSMNADIPVLSSITNNAAETLESTDTTDGDKPESAVAAAIKTFKLHTIAHFIPITRATFRDAKLFTAMVEQILQYGCMEKFETQIIQGANTPDDNIVGLHNTSGIQTQAYATDLLQTSRKALTKAKKKGRPNAWVMAPDTWETVESTRDGESRYYYSGPQGVGPAMLWGRPVVETQACPTTHFGLNDWSFAKILDLEQYTLHMSDSHSDFFIKNILTLLGEMTVGFAQIRPAAYVKVATS